MKNKQLLCEHTRTLEKALNENLEPITYFKQGGLKHRSF
jgi:hypothetical protein